MGKREGGRKDGEREGGKFVLLHKMKTKKNIHFQVFSFLHLFLTLPSTLLHPSFPSSISSLFLTKNQKRKGYQMGLKFPSFLN